MLEAGITQKNVAKRLGKTINTVNNWWRRNKRGESLDDKPRSGRPSSLTRAAKIIISKSIRKNKSTRKLTKRLKARGHQTLKTAVHRYLKENLGLKSYKRPRIPRLTKKQRVHRLKFCKERFNWSVKKWANVIFSDEAPFLLF